MNVTEIVREYLINHGFDGLYREVGGCAQCACLLADLVPCEEFMGGCLPGYEVDCACPDCNGFHVVPEKPEEKTKGERP